MARIPMVEYEDAGAEEREQFDDQIARNGRMTNMKKTLLHSLPAFHALMQWYPLRDAVREFLSEKEVNLFCHAISAENDCLVCSTFFRKIIIDSGGDPDNYTLDEREQAILDFGRLCVTDPHGINGEHFELLKKHFNDEQMVLLTAFAGLMIATNLINTALQVDLDNYLESYTKR